MKRIMLAATAAASLSLAACDPAMNGPETATAPGEMTPTAAMPFVMMAGASDLFEIESSRMAVQKAQRPEVRQYAQMLIQHHMMTTQQVTAAARAAGMNPPPPQLMPMQQRMLDELRATSNANFDAVYLRQQVPAHEMALALHRNYAQRGDTPSLRSAANGAVPIVTQHLEQARQMMR